MHRFKNTRPPSFTANKYSQKSDPKGTKSSKNGTWKLLAALHSVSFYPSESEDVTQLANGYGGCKLRITFLFKSENL